MDSSVRPVPAKKRDHSTAPSVAFIVSCVLAAYGFKTGNALFLWILPSLLVAGALVYAFVSSRGRGGPGQAP